MTIVIDDQLQQVRALVRDVLAKDVAELIRSRTTSPEALQQQLARVEGTGALDAAAPGEDGFGLEGAVVVAAELARAWGSLGWAVVPSLLLRCLGEPVPEGRIGLASPWFGDVPALDAAAASSAVSGWLGAVLVGAEADAVLLVTDRVAIVPRACLTDVGAARAFEGLREAGHDDLEVDGPVTLLEVPAESAQAALRLLAAAVAVGIGEAAVVSARDYQRQRIQFKHAIAEYGEMRAMLADGAAQVGTARQAVIASAQAGADAPTARAAAASAFLAASQAAVRASEMAQHSHGGYGHMSEFPVHALVRDARMISAVAGSHLQLDEAVLSGVDQL
jgi:alkylation response protein AidB-like acyl-CoA dehydrogenase